MRCLVTGAGGFIGHHLVNRLKVEGHFVRGIDLKKPEFEETEADQFHIADLRDKKQCWSHVSSEDWDEVYQLAADMGGAGYVFTGENDSAIMSNSVQINLNILETAPNWVLKKYPRIFFASSACVYQSNDNIGAHVSLYMADGSLHQHSNTGCREADAYPAEPDSNYGWEKLFSERLYQAYAKNYGLQVRIGRFHNIFGPLGTYKGGREKAPAALCRKVAEAKPYDSIEIWGDGEQTRSFLYVDEAIEGVIRLMRSDFEGPVNIGSSEMVSINQLALMIRDASGKPLAAKHIPGPLGVRGRNSDNTLIREKLGWAPSEPLRAGIEKTYRWIAEQVLTAASKSA